MSPQGKSKRSTNMSFSNVCAENLVFITYALKIRHVNIP